MAVEENDGVVIAATTTTTVGSSVEGEDRLARQERLQHKYDLCRRTKDEQVSKIKKLQGELQQILKKMPKRPRENIKELDEKIEALERQRTINSMPLAEERKILKDINGVQKIKSQVEAYQTVEKQVEDIRQQLSVLREAHREMIGETETTETELSKVKLANSLNCEVEDMTTKEIDCPKNRIGAVIGKNGSMIKHVEKLCHVQMNINKENDSISITGADDAIQRAIVEIDRIIQMQEEEIPIDESICNYLSARDVKVLEQWRRENPGVHMDTVRGSNKMTVRGDPTQINLVRMKIQGLTDVVSENLELTGKQVALIVGKKGVTIDKLCEEHELFILAQKIDGDSSSVTFTGPTDQVKAAINDVDALLSNNEEIETSIPVGIIMKQVLLAESGRHMKALQAKVREGLGAGGGGCIIHIGKDKTKKDGSAVLIKSKRSVNSTAVDLAKTEIGKLQPLVVTLTVDPFVTPKIIGKSGGTIKKLAPGVTTFLEVLDRDSGSISYGASTIEEREQLGEEIAKIVEENAILRIKMDPETLRSQLRDIGRTKVRAELDELVWYGIDEKESCFVLRGPKENLEKGKLLVEDFVTNNYLATVPITAEDIDGLLSGAKSSKIVEFAAEHDVKLSIDKENFLVVARGTKENVDAAKTTLSRYINGGDGYSVTKFPAGKLSGSIIGKGGKTRQELETKHGVSLAVSKTGNVTIRGPTKNVADCRVELQKLVATARTSRVVDITKEQKDALMKKDYEKQIQHQIPVQISSTDSKVTLAGTLADVSDAETLLNEMLTGEYIVSIELETPQLAKVRNATRDPKHFKRISTSSDAMISLDLNTGAIAVSGKRSNVRKAKEEIYIFLDFVLPGEVQRLPISKPLQQSVGKAATLAEVAAVSSGPTIVLDRDLGVIAVLSSNPEKVETAVSLLKEKIAEAERLMFVMELSAEESWIIPAIIGKNGSKISALRSKHRRCKIEVSKEVRTITILGDIEENLLEARTAIEDAVDKTRRETALLTIPEKHLPRFVGKGGAHVKEFASEHDVDLTRLRHGLYNYKISGDEENVSAAVKAVQDWLVKANNDHPDASVKIFLSRDDDDIGSVIGKKGAIVKSIEEGFGCKLDIRTDKYVVIVRCDNTENRQAAVDKVKEIIEADKEIRKAAKEASAANGDHQETISSSISEDTSADNDKKELPTNNKTPPSVSQPSVDNRQSKNPANPYPLYPVGVKPPANNGKAKKKSKNPSNGAAPSKPPATVSGSSTTNGGEGTEDGKNLYAMLVSDS